MGVRALKVRLLVDEFDFSGDSNGVTVALNGEAIDASAFQQDGALYVAGLPSASIEHNGYFTGAGAGEIEQELSDRLGTETPVTVAVLLDTRALGNPAYVLDGTWGQQLTIEMPVKELITLMGKWASMPMRRGYTLLDGAVAATGAGTVVTLPAAGANGGKAFLFVRAVAGTANDATVTVQCDDAVGMPSPTTKGTFTFDDVGVYEIDLTGTVERYVRVNVTSLGGATGITAACVLCVNGVTG